MSLARRPAIRSWSINKAFVVLTLIVFSLISLFPFWTMMMMSTYKTADIYTGVKLLPGNYFGENLKSLSKIAFPTYYSNSLIVAASCAILTVFVCSMAGYAFAKFQFRGKDALMGIVVISLMIPVQLGIVGLVIEMKTIGWLSTLWPLIIPNSASAFGVFWMSQFTKDAIPDSVIESARIDGCNEFQMYLTIALPFMVPACMALALLSFLSSWNAFLVPTILITNEKLYTIPMGIRQLATQYRFDVGAQLCGLTFATIPMLIMFSMFSKYLITGLSAAAVKE
jgi:cellobiose transport system permease protein